MKNLIMYMYNLKNINIYKKKNYIQIKDENKEYLLYKVINPKRVYEINEILNNSTEHYKFAMNINNEVVTIYNNEYYVLIEVNNIYKIHSSSIKLNVNKYQNYQINQSNWVKLWSIKNDYYESLTIKNQLIEETINYYVGLAENAIEFVKNNDIDNQWLNICILNIIDEHNPLNVVLDCKEREIAEKIKHNFFYGKIEMHDIKKIIKNYNIKKIIGRLLYPNYYFDIVDEFIQGKIDETKLKNIISKQEKYEKVIKELYIITNSNFLIAEWIIKDK